MICFVPKVVVGKEAKHLIRKELFLFFHSGSLQPGELSSLFPKLLSEVFLETVLLHTNSLNLLVFDLFFLSIKSKLFIRKRLNKATLIYQECL